jgi:ribonucleotide monophosphatase NagD (HAD superfamily)
MSIRLDPQNPQQYAELIDKYDTWLFDCDGVLWSGDSLIDGAKEVLDILRKKSASGQLLVLPLVLTSRIGRQKRALCNKQCDKVSEDIQEEA